MNIETAIKNLCLLREHPDLDNVSVDPDGTLVEGRLSKDKQALLLDIINETFAFAAEYEAQKQTPLCVRGETPEGKRVNYSAGRVFASLKPPEDVTLLQRTLVDEVHSLVSIVCADSVVCEVDVEILKRNSPFFTNLFSPHFKEGMTLKGHVPCSSAVFETLLRFFEGTPLPSIDDNIGDLVHMAGLLLNDNLNHALIQQLVSADNLDGQSWGILCGVNPSFFCSVLNAASEQKKMEILNDFFMSFTEKVTVHKDPIVLQALEDLLQDSRVEQTWNAIRRILGEDKVFDVDFRKIVVGLIGDKKIKISGLNWDVIGRILHQSNIVDVDFQKIVVDLINDKEIKISDFNYDLVLNLLSRLCFQSPRVK